MPDRPPRPARPLRIAAIAVALVAAALAPGRLAALAQDGVTAPDPGRAPAPQPSPGAPSPSPEAAPPAPSPAAPAPSASTATAVPAPATAARFEGRRGGRRNLVARGGGSAATESAVVAGLRWLARHQGADGGWHADAFAHGCAPGTPCAGDGYSQFDVGVTGLAVLAFLGAGHAPGTHAPYEDPYTHARLDPGACVERGLAYLRAQQDEEGCVGARTGEFMYDHAIATEALAEASGMAGVPADGAAARQAVAFLSLAQNPYRAWRYTVKPGDNDTSVTSWCVAALRSAGIAGLPTARTSYDGAIAWLDSVTDADGEVGYNGLGRVDVVVKGKNEAWSPHPSMTAIGLLCRIFIERDRSPKLAKLAARIVKDLPRWEEAGNDRPIDFYYWYYGSLALFQYDGPDGKSWKQWNEAMKAALLQHQAVRKDGCADGSWDPAVDRWGFCGGRVAATAMNVLTLETYYRFEAELGKKR